MRALIFDIDGTLLESTAVDAELYFLSISEVLGPVRFRENLHDYDHVTDSGILMQVLRDNEHSFDSEVTASIQALFVEKIRKHIEAEGPFPAIDGAIRFFENAGRSDGIRIAIATGGWRESALLKLESAGFNVDGIPLVSSDDSPSRIEIMRLALKKMRGSFQSVTYFGDAQWDQRACGTLGWKFVAVGPDLGGIESYEKIDL